MTLPNIGLIGKLRAGKDVVAAYLASKYGYTRFAFGDELKRYAHEIFGEPLPGTKPRALYQTFGQACRTVEDGIWIRKCLAAIDWRADDCAAYNASLREHAPHIPTAPFRAVITDCRQPNEYEALAARSYVLIRVDAPDGLRIQRAVESGDTFEYADLMHGTETALDGYLADFTVTNDGTLTELYAQIDDIIAELSAKEAA
ncbi:adenylate kinase [Paenibacillus sp. FSL L8-0436]|uniref:adenylate kinase n=1 Tax=Paenibacillus sp. FSL L8-0436 TaxID=2954686 RepID=UPI0031585B44